jgi:hypothetical protein
MVNLYHIPLATSKITESYRDVFYISQHLGLSPEPGVKGPGNENKKK